MFITHSVYVNSAWAETAAATLVNDSGEIHRNRHESTREHKLLQTATVSCPEVKRACTLPGFTGIFLHDYLLTSERLRSFSVTAGSVNQWTVNWLSFYFFIIYYYYFEQLTYNGNNINYIKINIILNKDNLKKRIKSP